MSKGTKQRCSFIARVANQPEVEERNGVYFGRIRVATDGGRKKSKTEEGKYEQLTTWLTITLFSHDAKFCQDYINKGDQISFDANIRSNEWSDDDGAKHYDFDFVDSHIMKLGKRETTNVTDELLPNIQ